MSKHFEDSIANGGMDSNYRELWGHVAWRPGLGRW